MAASVLLDDDSTAADVQTDALERLGVGWFRPWSAHLRYFEGLELVKPGLVYANDWRPDTTSRGESRWHTFLTGGVGRKPT